MSNDLAIATVTEALAGRLQAALSSRVGGAQVRPRRPADTGEPITGPTALLHLYRVTPNAAWRNSDLPSLGADGRRALRPPRAALDLHYLLCFYGNDDELEPQRLLGSAVADLQAQPVLTRRQIHDGIARAGFLRGSDLEDSVELIRLTPAALSLEDLARLWGLFPQASQALALAYEATVVLIEPAIKPQIVELVIDPKIVVAPFKQPAIERVEVHENTLRIHGSGLRGPQTVVRIGRPPLLPAEQPQARASGPRRGAAFLELKVSAGLSDALIQLPFPAGVPAGIHGLQVVHLQQVGATLRAIAESSAAPLLVRPRIGPAGDGLRADGTSAFTVIAGAPPSLRVAEIAPALAQGQEVRLLLNKVAPPAAPGEEVGFYAHTLRRDAVEGGETALSFPLVDVSPGEYLVRLQVDGIQSPLKVEQVAGERRLVGPKVTLP